MCTMASERVFLARTGYPRRARESLSCALRSLAIPMGVQPVPQSTIPVSSVTPPCLGALCTILWCLWVWVFVSASYVITMDAAFSVYLSFLLVRVALKLRSLRIHIPRLCRFELF